MSTVIETPPRRQIANEYQRFVLDDVSWESYEAMLAALGERPGLRLTYDRGELELMTKSQAHEFWSALLAQAVQMLCSALSIPRKSGGGFTFRKEDVRRGLEPDQCFWIQNERATRGKVELDFAHDPPPDLAIEVEVSRGSLDRHGIDAALGVPELWAFDGTSLRVYHIDDEGVYRKAERSLAFPFLPVADVPRFLRLDDPRDEQTRLDEFVAWAREEYEKSAE